VAACWFAAAAVLAAGWRPCVYLALILVWALPPILLQLVLGGDILWHYRKLAVWALIPATVYLAAADSLAISGATWTIDPSRSTQVRLSVLPLEELVFFCLTNTLIVFGTILVLAQASQERIPTALYQRLRRLAESRT
jgi:lycopene cyclase domain-containing protein